MTWQSIEANQAECFQGPRLILGPPSRSCFCEPASSFRKSNYCLWNRKIAQNSLLNGTIPSELSSLTLLQTL